MKETFIEMKLFQVKPDKDAKAAYLLGISRDFIP